MAQLKIYWTSVEFSLMKSHVDYKKYKGGMVYAFVNSSNKSDALIRFKTELYLAQPPYPFYDGFVIHTLNVYIYT